MSHFQTLQTRMQSALLQDLPLPYTLLTPSAQFGVYLNAYRARLRAALRDNFEVLPLVMGDDAFDALANAYIDAHPSTHYSIRWFGHQLGSFMAANEALVAHPAMVDLARLEWALRQAFDAASDGELTFADLAGLSAEAWPTLRLVLHPSVQLLNLSWAVGPVWHALKAGQDQVDPPKELAHASLVWRRGLQPQWQTLSETQLNFVLGLQAGHTFSQLCETLAETVGEDHAAQSAATVLRELLDRGVISHKQTFIP